MTNKHGGRRANAGRTKQNSKRRNIMITDLAWEIAGQAGASASGDPEDHNHSLGIEVALAAWHRIYGFRGSK